jgi:hypothetical protein
VVDKLRGKNQELSCCPISGQISHFLNAESGAKTAAGEHCACDTT